MQWYDLIAPIYDLVSERTYRPFRRVLVEHLNLRPEQRVLVVACGTGLGFPFLEERLRGSGVIVGVDFSARMLARARERIRRHGWENVVLLHMDARQLSSDSLSAHGVDPHFDVVVGELAFSVIPEWQSVMRKSWELLVPGGRFGILDWYRPRRDILTNLVNFTAHADVTRDIAGEAKALMPDFRIVARGLGGNVFVGVGTKS